MTYTYLGDLGGKFPVWAQEKAWREESVQYFRAIRRKLGLPEVPKELSVHSFQFSVFSSEPGN